MITKEMLMPFCDKSRPRISHPGTIGEFTYATNGRIMVWVPRLPDIETRADFPNCKWTVAEIGGFKAEGIWEPLQKIEVPSKPLCWLCLGDRKTYGPDGISQKCRECEGTGRAIDAHAFTEIGGSHCANIYLLMIEKLHGPLVNTTRATKEEPLSFKFAGGCGLLMPLRQWPQSIRRAGK